VLHKKTAAPFEEKFAPADLAEMFKSFPENKIDISPIAGMDPIEDNPPTVENGILTLDGHFATSPLEVNYVLSLVIEEGYWRLIGFDISARAPE